MKRILLAALVCAAGFVRAGEPVLRAGIMTDTHIGETAESCAHVRKAFELFRAQKADLVVNLGNNILCIYCKCVMSFLSLSNRGTSTRKRKTLH